MKVRETSPTTFERMGEGQNANPTAILKYGRRFLRAFKTERHGSGLVRIILGTGVHESPASIQLLFRVHRRFILTGKAKIGFAKDAVVIESIQGFPGSAMEDLNAALKQPWANLLIQTIEKNARANGYKKIYLANPENMHWFHNPATGFEQGSAQHEDVVDFIQKNMKNFYGRIAKANGFKKEARYFVKEI